MDAGAPDVSVAVASRERPVRLRWLLNALAGQTLGRERWEVVVAYDSRGPESEALLSEHPLAVDGTLRHLTFAPGAGASEKRNAAWRAARAPLIVFTDDDCRPPADWLERVLEAAAAHPGAIVQGSTEPDPDEVPVLRASPWPHTNRVEPPTVWAETCNIVYPRSVLERMGGFDPILTAGEDTDLALRARAEGVPLVAAPATVTYHAVDDLWLGARLRSAARWEDLARVLKRHPELRRSLYGHVWWKREHATLMALALGAALGRRHRLALGLALPWLSPALTWRGYSGRGFVRALSELPGRAAIDLAETMVLARASIRHRTLLL